MAATIAVVEASSHPRREFILRQMVGARNHDGTARYTDASVENWLREQRVKFPLDPTAEEDLVWARRAARRGDSPTAHRLLLRWADGAPRTWHPLNTLQYELAGLGYLAEAIEVQAEVVAVSETAWNQAGGLRRLIGLYRAAGGFAGARESLRPCGAVIPTDEQTKGAGLWRSFVKAHFLLVLMAPDESTAELLLPEGDRQLNGVPRLWMDGVLPTAVTAHGRGRGRAHR